MHIGHQYRIENFQTLYITKALQLDRNIVIGLNHLTIGEKQQDDPLSSHELSLSLSCTPNTLLVMSIFIHSI